MSIDDTRARLLHAAGPIFADKGFQGATVREICERAGVNVASIKYYFGDKERLYIETVKEARRIKAEPAPFPQWSDDVPPETRLQQFIHTLLTRMFLVNAAPWPTRLMLREILEPTTACQELVQEFFRPEFEMLLEILDAMLPPGTPPYRRYQFGFSVVGQCAFYRLAGGVVSTLIEPHELADVCQVDALSDHITRFTLAALGRVPPLGAPRPMRPHGCEILPRESEN